jgi:Polysulphide reductase, NrfD
MLSTEPYGSAQIPRGWMILFAVLALAGAAAFLMGIGGPQSLRAWQAYLVNYIFWTGLSFGGVLFAAVLNMTDARWGRSLKRLAEGLGAFLPASFLLFWVLYPGREEIFPWIREPSRERAGWLSVDFLFARNGAGLLLLTLLSMTLISYSVKADRQFINRPPGTADPAGGKPWKAQRVLSPIIGILYAFILSLLAFDLIMSLDPHWYSTLFGAYYFMSSFFAGLAALVFVSHLLRRAPGLQEYIHPHHLHDLGKLLFAFCLFTGYLFYVQFLVIWYGNLPEETKYIILRIRFTPWEPLAWTVLGMIFILPFLILLRRKWKMNPAIMIPVSLVVLAGMWLERFILVAPSLWKEKSLPLGLMEVLITAGFFGIMALSLALFLQRAPLLPVSDPFFREAMQPHEEKERP